MSRSELHHVDLDALFCLLSIFAVTFAFLFVLVIWRSIYLNCCHPFYTRVVAEHLWPGKRVTDSRLM